MGRLTRACLGVGLGTILITVGACAKRGDSFESPRTPSPSEQATRDAGPLTIGDAGTTAAPTAPGDPTPTLAAAEPAREPEPLAVWIEPNGALLRHTPAPCTRIVVTAAKGALTVAAGTSKATDLREGDTWSISRPEGAIAVGGAGLAALVEVKSECPCDPTAAKQPPVERKPGESVKDFSQRAAMAMMEAMATTSGSSSVHVMPRAGAPKFTWAKGAMSAELSSHDTSFQTCEAAAVASDGKPHNFNAAVYLGRLSGTSAVAEHVHDGSWEVLFALEADGTMTLAGAPRHVGARDIIKVPPGVKHSWAPARGSKLVAVQAYAPPGPEQRFRTLAEAPKR